jgi:lipoprotein NlpD
MHLSFRSRKQFRIGIAVLVIGFILSGCASQYESSSPARIYVDAASLKAGYYRTVEGDTLASVAAAYGREATQIAQWNGLPANAALSVGQIVRVGPPAALETPAATHTAPPSDTQHASKPACSADALMWPVKGPVLARFGVDGSKSISIGGQVGDTIRSAGNGKVVYVGDKIKGYGLLVIVKHSDRYLTAYGNTQRVLVKEGNDVTQGQSIALMGGASATKGTLLFEVRKDRQPVDPMGYLSDCGS